MRTPCGSYCGGKMMPRCSSDRQLTPFGSGSACAATQEKDGERKGEGRGTVETARARRARS